MRQGEADDGLGGGVEIGAALLHDLRTPLAALRMAAEIVAREPLSPTQKDALSIMAEAADALLAMTEGAIAARSTLSPSESGDKRAALLPAGWEIRSISGLFAFLARSKSIGFSLDLDAGLNEYRLADPIGLRRILSALIDNAIKYTSAGSVGVMARLGADGTKRLLELDIVDTGCGISATDRDIVFQAYRRAGPAGETAAERPGGTGLGLWNARRLAAGMGGTLELAETSQAGSRFRLTLPLQACTGKQSPPEPAADALPLGGMPLRILVVDDNATSRRLLGIMLEAFGCEPVPAASGREALDLFAAQAERELFDAVLLDLSMPEMDGEATAKALRLLPKGEEIPILAMSAAANPLDGIGGIAVFDAVLAKPITPASLYHAVSEATYRHPD